MFNTVISNKEKIDYSDHIIKTGSETKFIECLDAYLRNSNNVFEKFDWWMFSKIDETMDDVFIPYYNHKTNNLAKFKPDFIFWLLKDNNYFLLFVDPKSPKFTEYEHKVDGFKRIYENKNNCVKFSKGSLNIRAYLCLITENLNEISLGYRKYWFNFDSFTKLVDSITAN